MICCYLSEYKSLYMYSYTLFIAIFCGCIYKSDVRIRLNINRQPDCRKFDSNLVIKIRS